MAQLNVFFLALGFWLGRIHPPSIHPDLEQSFVDLMPIKFARVRAGRVVHRHGIGVVGRLGEFELVDEPTLVVHEVVISRSRFEEGPDGNHEVEVLAVQAPDHPLGIGIVLIENEFALAIPPEPVLHDIVGGDMQFTIFLGDAQNLLLRFVAVLALPEAIGPLAEHWRRSGEFAVGGDDLIEIGAVEKIVVDDVSNFGADVEIIGEAVVETTAGIIVPENPIAVARHEKGHGDVGVVLRDVDGFAAVVPHAGLMLSESVEGFVRAVNVHKGLGAIGILAVYFYRRQAPGCFLHQSGAAEVAIGDGTVLASDGNFQLRGGQRYFVVVGLHGEFRGWPTCLDDDGIGTAQRERRSRRVEHMHDRVRAYLQSKHPGLHGEAHTVGLWLDCNHWVPRHPLRERRRHKLQHKEDHQENARNRVSVSHN